MIIKVAVKLACHEKIETSRPLVGYIEEFAILLPKIRIDSSTIIYYLNLA